MKSFEDQVRELQRFYPGTKVIPEGGINFLFLPEIELPSGCLPEMTDALLCPEPRDGYHTRLFYSKKIEGIPQKNWNGVLRVCDKNWYSYSWKSQGGMNLIQMVRYHLSTLKLIR